MDTGNHGRLFERHFTVSGDFAFNDKKTLWVFSFCLTAAAIKLNKLAAGNKALDHRFLAGVSAASSGG